MKHYLSEMFQKQKQFCALILKEKYNLDIDNLTPEQRLQWTKEFILSGTKEMMEMLDCLNWKTHREGGKDNNDNFLEEGIDAFKFLLCTLIINGFNEDDFVDKFFDKTEIVELRYQQEKDLKALKDTKSKIFVFDIDGVLNDYPTNFVTWCDKQGIEVDYKIDRTHNPKNYKKNKHQFRSEGGERTGQPNIQMIEIIKEIKSELGPDNKILLLTARSYKKYNRIFSDTLYWLKRYKIPYDYIFFEEKKEDWLINNFEKEQISFVIDDQIDNVNKLVQYFDNVYLYRNNELFTEDDYKTVNSKVKIASPSLDNLNVFSC